ncbi:hypothetical protein [Sphingomonas sp.]|jgi:hypothetical protein|uniref:hypothetical protein n=1 Tax=Sphingomonas sp. TaxID=28214 RepID=UPI002ED87C17
MAASLAAAQTGPAPFAGRLDQARTTLQVDESGLHGPGAAVIAAAVEQARYVLLGEDHLSREIPRFTVGMCRIMAPGGLRALAVETGPEAAVVVNSNLRRPDRATRIAAFAQKYPDAMAFLNGRDESDMASECARLAGPGFEIWGLDQEFFGSAGYLLEQMLAAHPGPNARAAIERLVALDRSMSAAAVASGSPGDLFIYKVTDRQIAEASGLIARDGGVRGKALFAALVETRSIYLGQNTDGYASNGQRARLMKRNLVGHLTASPSPARVLFKFGDVHMAKGINGLGQRDLGNFAAERAEGDGASSVHIAVYGAKGVHALYGGVGRQVRHEPFVLTDDADYAWLKDALATRPGEGQGWVLIDLRALRTKPAQDMPAPWRKVAQRYDLLVIAPDLTPSSLLGAK